jgi:hypothetical protein
MTPEVWATMDSDARWEYAGDVMDWYRNGEMLPWYGFNDGGAASDKAKAYIRALLKRHAGRDDAEVMRWYLNEVLRTEGRIGRYTATAVLTVLTRMN